MVEKFTDFTLDDLETGWIPQAATIAAPEVITPVAHTEVNSPNVLSTIQKFSGVQSSANQILGHVAEPNMHEARKVKMSDLKRLADTATGKTEQKQEIITVGTKIIASFFAKHPIRYSLYKKTGDIEEDEKLRKNSEKAVYDIVERYYDNWHFDGITQDFSTAKTQTGFPFPEVVYGKFVRHDIISEYIDELNLIGKSLQQNTGDWVKPSVREFKTEIGHRIFSTVVEGKQVLDIDDVNGFVKVMIQNKLRSDRAVKENLGNVLIYCGQFTSEKDKRGDETEFVVQNMVTVAGGRVIDEYLFEDLKVCRKEEYDNHLQRKGVSGKTWEELRDLFCQIEFDGWKEITHKKYHKFINKYGWKWLHKLKKSFVDKFGDPFRPQGWQCEILLCPVRFMYVAASRRSGKTFLATYLSARQLYLPGQQVMYIIPTKENHSAQPWGYLSAGLGDDENMVLLESSLEIKHVFPQLGKGMTSLFKMYSDSKIAVRSQTVNLVVYDEQAFLEEDTCDAARPTIATEKGFVYGISTVDPDTPKNHFYYDLIDAEIEQNSLNSTKKGMRVTLLDNPFIDDDEKEQIIKNGIRKPKTFRAEWMADFQESSAFDLSKFWTIDYDPMQVTFGEMRTAKLPIFVATRTQSTDVFSKYLIIHDAGKRKDQPGFVILGLKPNDVQVICSGYLEGLDYYDQCKVIEGALNYFGRTKSEVIIELNENGSAVDEILIREHKIYATCIQVVGGLSEKIDGRYYNIGRTALLTQLKVGIAGGVLSAYSFMQDLRKEVETYSDDKAENDKRKGGHHFDILACLRLGAWMSARWGFFDGESIVKEEPKQQGDAYVMKIIGGAAQKTGSDADRIAMFGH